MSDMPFSPVDAGLKTALVGTWELVSYHVELKETGALIPAMGESPRGRVVFTDNDWVAFHLEGSDRLPAHSDQERARLMESLVAYIGTYRIEGDQWVTSVQTAWAPEWVGTEQHRTVRIQDGQAHVLTPWRQMPNWAPDQLSRSRICFRKLA